MTDGTHLGLDFEAYQRIPGINKSSLDILHRSPAHYQHIRANPREETAALRIGSALHTLILEPDAFFKRYFIADGLSSEAKEAIRSSRNIEDFQRKYIRKPKFDRRTKDGKAAADSWEREHAESIASGAIPLSNEDYELVSANIGKDVLSSEEHKLVQNMSKAVYANEDARELLAGDHEVTAVWKRNGLLCKARADGISFFRGFRVILDVKTADDASPRGFERAAYEHRYHVQAAWYLDGFAECAFPAERFVFVVVEKHPPHNVVVYAAEDDFVAAGRREYEDDFSIYEKCISTDSWPGYADEIVSLRLPRWVR